MFNKRGILGSVSSDGSDSGSSLAGALDVEAVRFLPDVADGRSRGGGGGGSPCPIPLSGEVLQLAAQSPSVLRRLLSNSVEAKDMSRSKPLEILSCHFSVLPLATSSSVSGGSK